MFRTTIFLTGQQLTRLKALVKRTGLTLAEHVRRAIDAYLDKT